VSSTWLTSKIPHPKKINHRVFFSSPGLRTIFPNGWCAGRGVFLKNQFLAGNKTGQRWICGRRIHFQAMRNLPRMGVLDAPLNMTFFQNPPHLILLFFGCIFSTSLLTNCADGGCAEQLRVEDVGKHHITVRWRHDCYTCDTWELCYKKAGVFNGWVCVPHAAPGAVRGDTYTISGLVSGDTYLITVKNVMGQGCRLKTVGIVEQKTR